MLSRSYWTRKPLARALALGLFRTTPIARAGGAGRDTLERGLLHGPTREAQVVTPVLGATRSVLRPVCAPSSSAALACAAAASPDVVQCGAQLSLLAQSAAAERRQCVERTETTRGRL